MSTKGKVTPLNCILAKCKDCCGKWEDGRTDCQVTDCPLYSYMPYAKLEANLECLKYNPKKAGDVTWEECAREMTDEQRQAAAERLKAAREARNKK